MATLAPTGFRVLVGAVIALLGALALVAAVRAAPAQQDVTYSVTIENLTDGQPLTPPLLAVHTSGADLFEVGQAASDELKEIAENGNLDPMIALLNSSDAVTMVVTGDAPILPGGSATLSVDAPAGSRLSWVSMLICTNDGFTGVDSLDLQASGSENVDTDAYDAGTETNTEDFADIVPPCQSVIGVTSDDDGTGASNPALAEGSVVSTHSGVQGGTDLTVADHGWTDPVARVTVTASANGLPDSGGPPTGDDSSILWIVALAIGGAALVAGGGATVALARRRTR
jgi:hypothetical protein